MVSDCFIFAAKKPEKLETFNEDAGEQEILATADRNPNLLPKKSVSSLKPGQRFFVLNGQNLFPSYPVHTFNGIPQGVEPLKYEQAPQQDFLPQQQQIPAYEQFLQTQQQYPFYLRSPINYAHNELNSQLPSQNVISLNQPQDFKANEAPQQFSFTQQESYPAFPYSSAGNLQKLETREKDPGSGLNENYNSEYLVGGSISKVPLKYYQYETTRLGPENDDSVVIDAKDQSEKKPTSSDLKGKEFAS